MAETHNFCEQFLSEKIIHKSNGFERPHFMRECQNKGVKTSYEDFRWLQAITFMDNTIKRQIIHKSNGFAGAAKKSWIYEDRGRCLRSAPQERMR